MVASVAIAYVLLLPVDKIFYPLLTAEILTFLSLLGVHGVIQDAVLSSLVRVPMLRPPILAVAHGYNGHAFGA